MGVRVWTGCICGERQITLLNAAVKCSSALWWPGHWSMVQSHSDSASLCPEMVTAEVWPATSTPHRFHIWESRNACPNPIACQQHNPYSDAIKKSAQFLFVCSQSKDCGVWGSKRPEDNISCSPHSRFLYFILGLIHGQVLGVSLVVILWSWPLPMRVRPMLSRILTIVLLSGIHPFKKKNPFL